MRILHVIPGLDARAGGPVSAMSGLTLALAREGAEVTVLSASVVGEPESSGTRLIEGGVRVRRVGPVRGALGRHPGLAPAVQEEVRNADVVHLNGVWEEVQHLAATSAHQAEIPYVWSPHGMLTRWALSEKPLKKRLYLFWRLRRDLNHGAMLHYASTVEQASSAELGLDAPTLVEPFGVDLADYDQLPPRGTFRARHSEIGQRVVALFLGRLHQVKGLDLLIEAFARARTDASVLVLAGPDTAGYRARLQPTVDRYNMQDQVVWTGMLDESRRAEALVDADLFVLPSRHENFGMVVIEALAAECPVLLSDRVGIHEDVQRAGAGESVPLSVDALAEALGRWLRDPALRDRHAKNARAFVREHYDWSRIARRWLVHYGRLARRPLTSHTSAPNAQVPTRVPSPDE